MVGTYASAPADAAQRDRYEDMVKEATWVSGLELPYPGLLAADPRRVAQSLNDDWTSNVVTAIPGTMQRVAADPTFGLASPDAAGRTAAIDFTRSVCRAVQALAEAKGRGVVAAVELHSAPTRQADPAALSASLEEAMGWDWAGAQLVVEHCDQWTDTHTPEKGFLPLEAEIEVVRSLGLRMAINWGRACLEERAATAASAAVEAAHRAGVLAGLMFSGVSPRTTAYGRPWADAHLPAAEDDPDSLMTCADITSCTEAASQPVDGIQPLAYIGAKISAPTDSSPTRRLQLLETIARAVNVHSAPVTTAPWAQAPGQTKYTPHAAPIREDQQ
ncbi:MAG TPA: DUF4862 family protein [Propionicimonas sp.]